MMKKKIYLLVAAAILCLAFQTVGLSSRGSDECSCRYEPDRFGKEIEDVSSGLTMDFGSSVCSGAPGGCEQKY